MDRVARKMDRREVLKLGGGAALAWAAGPLARLGAVCAFEEKASEGEKGKRKKRILFYTRSQTFEHSAVKRKDKELGFAEKLLMDLGARHGFEVDATKDGRRFGEGKESLARYDAFFFYTTGNPTLEGGDKEPPMPPEGKKALLDLIESGKGFIGSHCANDTFHTQGDPFETQDEEKRDPFVRMLGGEFIRHGPQQEAVQRVVSKGFPGCADLGDSFALYEEWYSNKNFAPDIHVILVQETKGMKGSDYERPPYPATWARRQGKGRVFYTSMGHREDVWTNPKFQKLLLGGISWVLGEVEADLAANLKAAAPEASKMPPRPSPGK